MKLIIRDETGKKFVVHTKDPMRIYHSANQMECECQRWEFVEMQDTTENPWF